MINIKNLDILRLTVKFDLFAVAVKEGRYAGGDCNSKCGALYGFSGFDFTYCLDECRIGGQKLLKDKNTAPIAVSAKMARSYDSCVNDYCFYLYLAPPAYSACQVSCYYLGRSGSLDTVSDTMEPYPFTYSKVDGKKFLPDYKPATSNSLPAQPINSGKLLLC